AMIADAFDNRIHAGVADAKSFTHDAAKINLPRDAAIADHIAGDDVLLRLKRGNLRRIRDDPPARQPFAEVIVRITLQFQRHAFGEEASEALARVAIELEVNRFI